MTGEIYKDRATPSAYKPSKAITDFTKEVREDWATGEEILNKSWPELNNRSVIEDADHGQMMFNAFVDEEEENPDEAWKWRGTRSMARNKGIAMHAQLTASYLLPVFVAQNEDQDIDRDFSDIMRDIIEWMTYPENSEYQSAFLNVVFGMMDSPVTFLGAEWCEAVQRIYDMKESGEYEMREVLDEVLSGFQVPIYGPTEVLITNAYQRNIQKQRRIIKRRYIEYSEAQAKYGSHPYFHFVQAGVKTLYNDEDGLFYDVKDDDHPGLVEEAIPMCRTEDSEVPFLGGIYMGNVSDVKVNPMKHRDNKGAPKYNVVPFGYHRIGRHFFYFKSMMNIMRWDNALYDAMTEIVANRAMLEANMPVMISGVDKVDTEIMFPGAVATAADKDAKATPLLPSSNLSPIFNALGLTKESMSDASLSDVNMGQLPEASQKAYSVAQASAAAKKIIEGVGKSLGESVMAFGDLMKDIAINHITLPEAEELSGGGVSLKYRTFVLPDKNVGGKTVDKVLKFDDSLLGAEMTEDERTMRSLKLLSESGYPDNKKSIYLINPEMFANFKYYCKIDLKQMFPMNQEMLGALWQGLFPLLREDPYISQEDLRRKLLRPYQSEDLVKKPEPQQAPAQQGGPEGSALGNMAQARAVSTAVPLPGA